MTECEKFPLPNLTSRNLPVFLKIHHQRAALQNKILGFWFSGFWLFILFVLFVCCELCVLVFFKLLVLSIKGTQRLIMKVTLYACLNRQAFCHVKCRGRNVCALLDRGHELHFEMGPLRILLQRQNNNSLVLLTSATQDHRHLFILGILTKNVSQSIGCVTATLLCKMVN